MLATASGGAVLQFLRRPRTLNRVATVVAAYALVLQALFAGMAATQMAAAAPADGFVLCYGGVDTDHGDAPRLHHTCAICTFAAHAPPLPNGVATAAPLDLGTAEVTPPISDAPATVARRHTPRTSQGPPQAA